MKKPNFAMVTQTSYETAVTHGWFVQLNHTKEDALVEVRILNALYEVEFSFEIDAYKNSDNISEMLANITREQIRHEESK
jgi:hypothetical protein